MSDLSRSSSPASQRSRSGSRASSRSPSRSRSRSVSGSGSSSSSPRFVSATDSDSDKNRKSDKSGSGNDSPRRKVRTKKSSPKHNESDSEAEEEKETKRKPKKIPKKGKKKKDESEEGEISSNDSAKEEFDDGLDEDLIGDSEDRARLEKMTEREREEELFKRAETREAEKKRFEIQKKLKKEHKLKAKEKPEASEPGEADEEDGEEVNEFAGVENTKNRSQTRKEKMEEKKFDQKSSALSELKAKRQEKERKDAERHKKESEKEEKKKQRASSSSSSAGSGSERSRRSSSSSRSSSDGDSDTERFKKSPSKVQKYIESQEDLEPIRLSRFKMEKFVHLPFFKKLVMNCFVRIGIGQYQGRSVYRAAEIVDVVETGKVYMVGKMRTNIGTKLKFGKEERVFRLEFISNQRISPQEFIKWKEACTEANISLPTIESVKSKANEIRKASTYSFSSEDVDKMVKQKEKFQRHPVNYAMHKARLIKDKDIAIANGDEEKGKELEGKLNDLEERAEELDKKRTSTISSVSLINDRNRKANVSKAEEAIMVEIKKKEEEGEVSNPFIRRKCKPRMSSGGPSVKSVEQKSADQKENLIKVDDTTIVHVSMEKRKADEENEGKNKKKAKLGSGLPLSMQKEDLFDAHNFDIEIDVDVNLSGIPNPGAAGAMAPPISLKPTPSERAPVAKRSFNLDDYKKKRGLI